MEKFYIAITTIRHYKQALDVLIGSIPKEFNNKYIIIYQKEDEERWKVFPDGHIEVFLRQNLHDYGMYVGCEILRRNGVVRPDAWFLFIHDTCRFGADSYRLVCDYIREFDKSHVNRVWLCRMGRCNICLVRGHFVEDGCRVYEGIMELPKLLEYEWDHKNPLCPKSFGGVSYFLPQESRLVGNRYVYNKNQERAVLHFGTIDLEKYFFPFTHEHEHPKCL